MRLPLVSVAGQAMFEGCIAPLRIPAALLAETLPAELVLPPSGAGGCRCLLLFGEQSEGTAFIGGIPVPWGGRYHEMMVAVPNVRWTRTDGMYLFVLGMICDAWWAVWNGNVHYGFRKRLATVTWDGRRFVIAGDGDRDAFRAAVEPGPAASEPPVAWIQASADLPVLGCRSDGRLVHSRFEWDFETGSMGTAMLRLSASRDFRELPFGEHLTHPHLALRVRRMQWRLSWPVAGA